MIWIIIVAVLVLIGTHYMAFTIGEESGRAIWQQRMKKLQDYYLAKEARQLEMNKAKKLEVKSVVKKARKVAIKKK